jgi:hypothetical protein
MNEAAKGQAREAGSELRPLAGAVATIRELRRNKCVRRHHPVRPVGLHGCHHPRELSMSGL